MPYVMFYDIIFYGFSETATTVLESFTNSAGKQLLIIHVTNLFSDDVICIYFSVPFYSIAFIANSLIALDNCF